MVSQARGETETGYGQKLESLGALAGGIAHDFNNLLAGVIGNADVVRQLVGDDAAALEAVARITESAERASALCGQLLAYAGRGRFERRPLELGPLLDEMRPLLHTVAAGHLRIEVELAPGLLPIHADPNQVRQALVNLVTNAAEAIGDAPGVVRIIATNDPNPGALHDGLASNSPAEPGLVCIAVVDDGPGMNAI
ncbi:MAG: histidine kinase dimerization/phospho-acceptor domain-containing protein, partial [Myxococcota bacterium]